MNRLTRRDFIRIAGAAGAGLVALGPSGCKQGFSRTLAKESALGLRAPKVALNGVLVSRGADPAKITRAAIEAVGGMEKFVKKGATVVIKPNIAFTGKPENAVTTNPDVVAELVRLCRGAGASKVLVFDRTCNDARRTYKQSGIEAAAAKAGAQVKYVTDNDFVEMKIPKGKVLKSWWLNKDILAADTFINVPIAKHHGSTGLTLGMKNLMGCAGGERGSWHVGHLDQRIADVTTALKPDLVVLDAFRILKDHGPTGGSLDDVQKARTVAIATDPVAIDAWATTLFGEKPADVKYIAYASRHGLGNMDLNDIRVSEITL
jgi:uncharacterized protein (DUF362 family)